jgi:hypothetical protein
MEHQWDDPASIRRLNGCTARLATNSVLSEKAWLNASGSPPAVESSVRLFGLAKKQLADDDFGQAEFGERRLNQVHAHKGA